jgi:hypothetical protein
MHLIKLSDKVYDDAQILAAESGYATVDDLIENLVTDAISKDQENLDHKFTPKVIAELDRIDENVKSGAKTYTPAEADAYLREKADQWRNSNAS